MSRSSFRPATILTALLLAAGAAWAASPSFDCGKAEAGGIEALVCADEGLAILDRRLAEVYAAAAARAGSEPTPSLQAEQRAWLKERDDCRGSADPRLCVAESYRLRIAELQARYRLVEGRGPVVYRCDDDRHSEAAVTFFPTDPPTLIAVRGASQAFMVRSSSASGAKYQGRQETFWEHHGCEALITWGDCAAPLHCRRVP